MGLFKHLTQPGLPKDVDHERGAVGEDANAKRDSVPVVVVDRLLWQTAAAQVKNRRHHQHRLTGETGREELGRGIFIT